MKSWIFVLFVLAAVGLIASGVFSGREPDVLPEPTPTGEASRAASGSLIIEALAPEGATGHVAFALFDGKDSFAGKAEPLERGFVELDADGRAVWRLDSLAYGSYAAKAYHDENGNEVLDKGAFGIPREAYGFSRNARGRMGPPSYEDVRFALDAPTLTLEIRLSK